MSEDCLYMNIVRPSRTVHDIKSSPLLPVLVWLHGGGWQEGSANDDRYNGSFLVQRSVEMGTPIIYVNFNYRLGLFGRLSGPAVHEAGLNNLLLHDQRQAFAWIQENIAQFGGDKTRVTIMGESAGAGNVGNHILAPDEGFFSGAIAQSGGPFLMSPLLNKTEVEAAFIAALNFTGCRGASQPLDCLRSVPTEIIQKASASVPLGFVQDGELIVDRSSRLLKQGRFIKVPLLIGSNRNEGTTFLRLYIENSGPLNDFEDFVKIVTFSVGGRALPLRKLRRLWELYQDEIDNPSSSGLGSVVANGGPSLGSGYGKVSLWVGDSHFAAGRRFANQIWADHMVPSYSFLFDTTTAYLSPKLDGAAHSQEIPYVFGNAEAIGWEEDPYPTEPRLRAKHLALVEAMSSMWIGFVATGNPNNHKGKLLMLYLSFLPLS
jgi:carboxylesterase type B